MEIKTEQELLNQNTETFRDENSDAWRLKGATRAAESRSFFANMIATLFGMEDLNPEAFPVTENVGGWVPGDEVAEAAGVWPTIKKMLNAAKFPTFISPSFSLTNNLVLCELNSIVQVNFSFNFNRGQILGAVVGGIWQAGTEQAKRAGAATEYRFIGLGTNGADVVTDGSLHNSHLHTHSNYPVQLGLNTFQAQVTYAEGPQPKDSTDANYDAPFPGGTSALQATSFEGILPLFATTTSITTMARQPDYSMLYGNNIDITLFPEAGADKQRFDIPNAWLSLRPIADVQYFNPVSGQYDITGKLSDFTQSAVPTRTLNGVANNYTRFTHNGGGRGEVKIRLKF